LYTLQEFAAQFAFQRQLHQSLLHHQHAKTERNTDSALAQELALMSEMVSLAKHLLKLTLTDFAAAAPKVQSRTKKPANASQFKNAHVLMTMQCQSNLDQLLKRVNAHDANV
jgi:hypothetical protein